MNKFPGWCIRCMAWVETSTGMCPICGATTRSENPYAQLAHLADSKLPMQQIKEYVDSHPHREIRLHFTLQGGTITLRQGSNSYSYSLYWEDLLECNLDMLRIKLLEVISKMEKL